MLVSLMLILLSKGEKDSMAGVNNIYDDIGCKNQILKDRIKRFFINIKGIHVLLIIMRDKRVSTKFTVKSVDLL